MSNITKFKDKKTGEVYDLGPKTWEFTLTEEEYIEIMRDGSLDVSQKEGISGFSDEYKYGDKLVARALTGMGDMTFDFGTECMGDGDTTAFQTFAAGDAVGLLTFMALRDEYSLMFLPLQ